jgi:hypothetical protein
VDAEVVNTDDDGLADGLCPESRPLQPAVPRRSASKTPVASESYQNLDMI